MNKILLRTLRHRTLELFSGHGYPLTGRSVEPGLFILRFLAATTGAHRLFIELAAHQYSDTFALMVRWGRIPRLGSLSTYVPALVGAGREFFDLADAPDEAAIDFGHLTMGRGFVYHFVAGVAPDVALASERLRATGDGPEYKLRRIGAVLELLRTQLSVRFEPFKRSWRHRFGADSAAAMRV